LRVAAGPPRVDLKGGVWARCAELLSDAEKAAPTERGASPDAAFANVSGRRCADTAAAEDRQSMADTPRRALSRRLAQQVSARRSLKCGAVVTDDARRHCRCPAREPESRLAFEFGPEERGAALALCVRKEGGVDVSMPTKAVCRGAGGRLHNVASLAGASTLWQGNGAGHPQRSVG
jgi:hypothetical protein